MMQRVGALIALAIVIVYCLLTPCVLLACFPQALVAQAFLPMPLHDRVVVRINPDEARLHLR